VSPFDTLLFCFPHSLFIRLDSLFIALCQSCKIVGWMEHNIYSLFCVDTLYFVLCINPIAFFLRTIILNASYSSLVYLCFSFSLLLFTEIIHVVILFLSLFSLSHCLSQTLCVLYFVLFIFTLSVVCGCNADDDAMMTIIVLSFNDT